MMQRLIGALLILAALLFLAAEAKEDSPWLLPAFLLLFVPGWLYLLGLLGTPVWLTRVRRHPQGKHHAPDPPKTSHEYRYTHTGRGLTSWARITLTIVLVLPLLALAATLIIFVIESANSMSHTERLVWIGIGTGLALFVLALLLWVVMEHRTRLLATPSALHLYTPLRHVEIPWSDVVSLSVISLILGSAPIGTRYRVYGSGQVIGFTGGLAGAQELAALISRATGLYWTTD